MPVNLTISIDQNSQSIANNTSNVTVAVRITWTNTVTYNHLSPSGWVKIDGKTYNFTNTFNDNKTSSGTKTLVTKTVNISHAADGKKTLACSASFATETSAGTLGASASKELTTIARKSTLSVSNGTLDTAQTLTISEQSSSFNHRLYYKCGSSGNTYILGSSSSTSSTLSTSWKPPLSLAQYNTTGSSVSVTFTLQTYSGSTLVGSNSYTKTFSIPAAKVKPSATIAIEEVTNNYSTYGAYIQSLSKLKITVNPTLAYNSPIKSYKTTFDSRTYTTKSFTSPVISGSGSLKIRTTIIDSRGNSNTIEKTITALEYSPPHVSVFKVQRCNADGSMNDRGDYVKVTVKYGISSLNNQNQLLAAAIKYKQSSASAFNANDYIELGDTIPTSEIVRTFAADTGSSYDVQLVVADAVKTSTFNTVASTGFTIMHFHSTGRGMGIGKISEIDYLNDPDATPTLELGMRLWSEYGDVIYSPVEVSSDTDLDSLMNPGYYLIGNTDISKTLINRPPQVGNGSAIIEVFIGGNAGQRLQRYHFTSKDNPCITQRAYYGSSWGSWSIVAGRTSWTNLTVSSGFASYDSDSVPQYRVDGNTVSVNGAVKPTVECTTGSTQLAFASGIPSMYCPPRNVYTLCQGSNMNRWMCCVRTDGTLAVSRYGSTSVINIPVGAWLPFNVTYQI